MGFLMFFRARGVGSGGGGPSADAFLLEDGTSFLLLEDGSSFLLLE